MSERLAKTVAIDLPPRPGLTIEALYRHAIGVQKFLQVLNQSMPVGVAGGGFELTKMLDVSEVAPADNEGLIYNADAEEFQFMAISSMAEIMELDDIGDVNTTGALDGQIIHYDEGTSMWILSDQPSSGDVPFWDGSQWTMVNPSTFTEAIGLDDLNDVTLTTDPPVVVTYLRHAGSGEWTNGTVADLVSDLQEQIPFSDLSDVDTTGAANTNLLQFNGTNWVDVSITAVAGAIDLDDLNDVDTTGVSTDDVLAFDGQSWVPVSPNTIMELNDLTDVVITNVQQDDFLFYDPGSGGWVNKDIPTLFDFFSLGDLADTNLTGEINGSILQKGIGSNWVVNTTAPTSNYTLIWNGLQWEAGQVVSGTLASSSVVAGKIANNAIVGPELRPNSVTTTNITNLNVTTAKINDLAVTTAKINDLGVTTGKIANLAVTNGKLGADSVTGDKIIDDAVDTEHIVADAVGNAEIDWGTTGNQVDADDVPYDDPSAVTSETDVEGALDSLLNYSHAVPVTYCFRGRGNLASSSTKVGIIDNEGSDSATRVPSGYTLYVLSFVANFQTGSTATTYDVDAIIEIIGDTDVTLGSIETTDTSTKKFIEGVGTVASPLATLTQTTEFNLGFVNNSSAALGGDNVVFFMSGVLVA